MIQRDDQKPYLSALRAARDYQKRPTSMILHDPYVGHRKWWDAEWTPSPSDEAWTEWDYVLADAYQVIQDFTDKESGQWMPFDQSGDVWWDVKSKFSGASAAIEKERENRKELKPGESLYAVPVFGNRKPTLVDWISDIQFDKADLRTAAARNSRPPTAEERRLLKEQSQV